MLKFIKNKLLPISLACAMLVGTIGTGIADKMIQPEGEVSNIEASESAVISDANNQNIQPDDNFEEQPHSHNFAYEMRDNNKHALVCVDCDFEQVSDCDISDTICACGRTSFTDVANTGSSAIQDDNKAVPEPIAINKEELTYTELTTLSDDVKITVKGEMPEGTMLMVEEVNADDVNDMIDDLFIFKTWDIKLIKENGEEYQPEMYGETVDVTFSNIQDAVSEITPMELSVIHINHDDEVEIVADAIPAEFVNSVTVSTDTFSIFGMGATYAVSKMTSEGTVNVPLIGKKGTIYHMQLINTTDTVATDAFCLDLGYAASSGDTFLAKGSFVSTFTDIANPDIIKRIICAYMSSNNGSSFNLSYKAAQCLIWAAEEGYTSDDDMTAVLSALNVSDSDINNIIALLGNISDDQLAKIWEWENVTDGKTGKIQRFLMMTGQTVIDMIQANARPSSSNTLYIKVVFGHNRNFDGQCYLTDGTSKWYGYNCGNSVYSWDASFITPGDLQFHCIYDSYDHTRNLYTIRPTDIVVDGLSDEGTIPTPEQSAAISTQVSEQLRNLHTTFNVDNFMLSSYFTPDAGSTQTAIVDKVTVTDNYAFYVTCSYEGDALLANKITGVYYGNDNDVTDSQKARWKTYLPVEGGNIYLLASMNPVFVYDGNTELGRLRNITYQAVNTPYLSGGFHHAPNDVSDFTLVSNSSFGELIRITSTSPMTFSGESVNQITTPKKYAGYVGYNYQDKEGQTAFVPFKTIDSFVKCPVHGYSFVYTADGLSTFSNIKANLVGSNSTDVTTGNSDEIDPFYETHIYLVENKGLSDDEISNVHIRVIENGESATGLDVQMGNGTTKCQPSTLDGHGVYTFNMSDLLTSDKSAGLVLYIDGKKVASNVYTFTNGGTFDENCMTASFGSGSEYANPANPNRKTMSSLGYIQNGTYTGPTEAKDSNGDYNYVVILGESDVDAVVVTLDDNGGSNGMGQYYVRANEAYEDETCENSILNVEIPEKDNCQFLGYYDSLNGGKKIIAPDGKLSVSAKSYSEDITLYAIWEELEEVPVKITLNDNYGSGGSGQYYVLEGKAYSDLECEHEISSVSVPTKTSNNTIFDGYYALPYARGENPYVDVEGNILDEGKNFTEDTTIYANWVYEHAKIIFDKQGGVGGDDYVYHRSQNSRYIYDNEKCYEPGFKSVEVPEKDNYDFMGYYTAPDSSGKKVFDSVGNLLGLGGYVNDCPLDTTLYAIWVKNSYKVSFKEATDKFGSANEAQRWNYIVKDEEYVIPSKIIPPVDDEVAEPVLPSGDQLIFTGQWRDTSDNTLYTASEIAQLTLSRDMEFEAVYTSTSLYTVKYLDREPLCTVIDEFDELTLGACVPLCTENMEDYEADGYIYKFAGWLYGAHVYSNEDISKMTVNSNMTFIAVYKKRPFVLTFKANNPVGDPIPDVYRYYLDGTWSANEDMSPAIHTGDGRLFKGDGQTAIWTDDVSTWTLCGYFDTKADCSLGQHSVGDKMFKVSQIKNASTGDIESYVNFVGDNMSISEDTTVYGCWDNLDGKDNMFHSITYDAGDGVLDTNSQPVYFVYGQPYFYSEPTYVNTAHGDDNPYVTDLWYAYATPNDSTKEFAGFYDSNDTMFVDEYGDSAIATASNLPDEDIVLTAKYVTINDTDKYTITFVNRLNNSVSRQYKDGDIPSIPSNLEVETSYSSMAYDYTFDGWEDENGDVYIDIPAVTKDMAYTAHYKGNAIKYSILRTQISGKNDDGSFIKSSDKEFVNYGDVIDYSVIPALEIINSRTTQYVFDSWWFHRDDGWSDFATNEAYKSNQPGLLPPATVSLINESTISSDDIDAVKSYNAILEHDKMVHLVARYNETPIIWKVNYKDSNGNIYDTFSGSYTDVAKYVPANPTKDGYNFLSWNIVVDADTAFDTWEDEGADISSSPTIVYEAEFTKSNKGTVTFFDDAKLMPDGQNYLLSGPTEYVVGQVVTTPIVTSKEDNNHTYQFIGWTDNYGDFYPSNVAMTFEKTVVLVATYDTKDKPKQPVTYAITFKDWDGRIISTQYCEKNDTITIPDNPSRNGYTFVGWSPDVDIRVTESVEYVAQYEKTIPVKQIVTIVFKDYDDKVISSKTYDVDAMITVPSKPSRKGYTFTGWSPSISYVATKDATYKAQYTKNEQKREEPIKPTPTQPTTPTVTKYTITFKNYDGTVISQTQYEAGAKISVPANPVRVNDGQYNYTFKEWSPSVASTATGNATYTATYTSTKINTTTTKTEPTSTPKTVDKTPSPDNETVDDPLPVADIDDEDKSIEEEDVIPADTILPTKIKRRKPQIFTKDLSDNSTKVTITDVEDLPKTPEEIEQEEKTKNVVRAVTGTLATGVATVGVVATGTFNYLYLLLLCLLFKKRKIKFSGLLVENETPFVKLGGKPDDDTELVLVQDIIDELHSNIPDIVERLQGEKAVRFTLLPPKTQMDISYTDEDGELDIQTYDADEEFLYQELEKCKDVGEVTVRLYYKNVFSIELYYDL